MITFWTVMWKYVTPLVMIVIFIGAMISELVNPLQYVSYSDVSVCLTQLNPFPDMRTCL